MGGNIGYFSSSEPSPKKMSSSNKVGAPGGGGKNKLTEAEEKKERKNKEALELCLTFVNLLQNRKYPEALRTAHKILKIEPDNAQILEHLPLLEDIVDDLEDSSEEEDDDEDEKSAPSESSDSDGGMGRLVGLVRVDENPQE